MIAIVNTGPVNGSGPEGVHSYEVRINHRLITEFRHRRSDGLAKCLRSAADAVEKEASEWSRFTKWLARRKET